MTSVSLRSLVLGTAAMASVNVLRLVAQFVAIPVLARLLSPQDYGVIGIAMPFVLFGLLIANSGLGMSLVRAPQEKRDEWSTCFWLALLLGLGIALAMAALAPAVAHFYDEPQLTPVIVALAVVILLQSIAMVPGAALQQAKRFNTIAMVELASILCGIAIAVGLALSGAGVWALVGQQLGQYAMRATFNLVFTPFRPIRTFRLESAGIHIRFGRDVLKTMLVNFFSRAFENIVIGKAQGTGSVGLYAMSFQFLRLPGMVITGPLQYVLYSHLVSTRRDLRTLRITFLLLTRILSMVVFPAMALIAAAHQPFFHLLLSEKWASSGLIFAVAAPAAALQAVTAIAGTIMLACGRTDIQLRVASEFALLAVAGLLCSAWFGIVWVAATFLVSVFLYFPRQLQLVLPVVECRPSVYLGTMAVPALAALAGAIVYAEVAATIDAGEWTLALVAGATAATAILLSALVQLAPLRSELGALRFGALAAKSDTPSVGKA